MQTPLSVWNYNLHIVNLSFNFFLTVGEAEEEYILISPVLNKFCHNQYLNMFPLNQIIEGVLSHCLIFSSFILFI